MDIQAIIKALGVKKCNGGLDSAVEDLPLEKAMEVAKEKNGEGHLTGADLKAQTREVIGTCVSMRVKIDGHCTKMHWKLLVMENGTQDLSD